MSVAKRKRELEAAQNAGRWEDVSNLCSEVNCQNTSLPLSMMISLRLENCCQSKGNTGKLLTITGGNKKSAVDKVREMNILLVKFFGEHRFSGGDKGEALAHSALGQHQLAAGQEGAV